MSTNGFEVYKQVLARHGAELAGRLNDRTGITIEAANETMDSTQLAAEREMAIDRLAAWHRLAREISAAQRRIENGTYGTCLRCDDPIPAKRLDAIPWAAYCVVCQETVDDLHERAQAFRQRVA